MNDSKSFFDHIGTLFNDDYKCDYNQIKDLYIKWCQDNGKEIEEGVIDEFATTIRSRRDFGRDKYKTTMERTDLSTVDWLQHLKEELLDASIYAHKLQRDFKEELYDVDKMNDLVEENQKLKEENNKLKDYNESFRSVFQEILDISHVTDESRDKLMPHLKESIRKSFEAQGIG